MWVSLPAPVNKAAVDRSPFQSSLTISNDREVACALDMVQEGRAMFRSSDISLSLNTCAGMTLFKVMMVSENG